MTIDHFFAARVSRMKASEIRELLKLLDQPDIISFAGGIPDPAMFPVQDFQAALNECLSDGGHAQALQYAPSEGNVALREWIVTRMASLGVPCDIDNIIVTAGSQQALDYLGKLYLSPGDTALLGWPTYLGALGAFNAYEPRFDRLDSMDNRSAGDIAAAAQAAGGRLKFSYLSPDFANPTGVTLTQAQRIAILDQANALDIAVVEDAAYQSLRFEGDDIPPIQALEVDRTGSIEACRTIYCGSFSKTLSPGLRVGWICAAKPVIQQVVLLKQAGDLQTATLNQMAIAKVAQSGFDAHVAKICAHYGARRDAMVSALETHMPEGVSWTRPEGGMFVWLTLPKGIDAAVLLELALKSEKVAFVPGAAFYPDGSANNTLRLNFSSPDHIQIAEGISRLARSINVMKTTQ
ncbi:MAG: PLP-dependent aminotransferase family protein [Thalassovita sp.]